MSNTPAINFPSTCSFNSKQYISGRDTYPTFGRYETTSVAHIELTAAQRPYIRQHMGSAVPNTLSTSARIRGKGNDIKYCQA
jgi:hypothetical protein